MAGTREGTDNLWEAMTTQRAIRRWKPDPVPPELLWKLVEMATRAPSGSNQQPWRFLIIQDQSRRSEIARLMRLRSGENPGLKTYFERGAQSADRSQRLMLSGALDILNDIDSAPVIIIPVLYRGEGERIGSDILSGSSIYTAVQNLLLAARGLGLGSVMTTFQRMIEADLRQLLGIPENAMPVALLPIGYPDANFGPVNRKPVEDVTYWEDWGTDRTR